MQGSISDKFIDLKATGFLGFACRFDFKLTRKGGMIFEFALRIETKILFGDFSSPKRLQWKA